MKLRLVLLLAVLASAGCGGSPAPQTATPPPVVPAAVTATVAVDTNPAGIAVDSASNSIYVVNSPAACLGGSPGGVTRIDGATNSNTGQSLPFQEFQVSYCGFSKSRCLISQPVAIAVDSSTNTGYAYLDAITCPQNGDPGGWNVEVATLSMGNDALMVNPFTVGPIGNCGSNPFVQRTVTPDAALVAVNATTHMAYAAWPCDNEIVINDLATQSENYLAIPGKYPIAVAVNSTTNKVYVANRDSNNVTVIDGATNAVLTTVSDPKAVNPKAVAVNSTTNTVYVANEGSNNVTVIDGASDSIAATVAVGTSPAALDVNPETNFVYVANEGNSSTVGNVTVIDGQTNSVTTITDSTAKTPGAVAVNSVTNKVYVANSGSNNVTVIDGAHH
jgi:YVTN family beta-propeller protein